MRSLDSTFSILLVLLLTGCGSFNTPQTRYLKALQHKELGQRDLYFKELLSLAQEEPDSA